MQTERYTRRQAFQSAASKVAISVPFVHGATLLAQTTQAANDRLQLGLIGCGVRGKYLLANLPDDARVVALCDCSLSQVESALKPNGQFRRPLAKFADLDGPHCAAYQDYRTMLDREKLDGVIIATPDHHHALPMMLACERGMDVYVEKPLSLTVEEGRAMVEMAQKHSRIVQVGSQQRTMAVNRFACEFVRNGGLGEVRLVQIRNFPGPLRYQSLRKQASSKSIPKDLDWNLFCGPTEPLPYDRDLIVKDAYKYGFLTWRGWDLFRRFSGHLMTNWGGHSVDMVQYALGMDESGPVKVEIHKDRIDKHVDDMWHDKTPPLGNVASDREDKLRFAPVSMHYSNGTVLSFEPHVRQTVFHGKRGKLFLSRNQYRTDPTDLAPPPDQQQQAIWQGDGHVARPHLENWLSCIRSRSIPNAPVEAGHRTATICHLANIAREVETPFEWDPRLETSDVPETNRRLSRLRRAGFQLPSA